MSKITLNNVTNLRDTTTSQNTINTDLSRITTAFNNTLSRDGTSPNSMSASLDMNSHRVLNLPAPSTSTEPLRVVDAGTLTAGGTISVVAGTPVGGTTGQSLVKKSSSDFDTAWVSTPINVFNYGAVGDGVSDDTAAFQAACDAAGGFGSVFAPSGYVYLLNGLHITGSHQGLNLTIEGQVYVGPGTGSTVNRGIILSGAVNDVCIKIPRILGQELIFRPNSSNHLCAGISLQNSNRVRLDILDIECLTYGVEVRPDLSGELNALVADSDLRLNSISLCYYGLYGAGGTSTINHTEGTTIRGQLWGNNAYNIYKTNSTGSQHYWNVRMAGDNFGNVDAVLDVFDDFIDSSLGTNQSVYVLEFASGTPYPSLGGNAFTDPRSGVVVQDQSQNSQMGSGPAETLLYSGVVENQATLDVIISQAALYNGIKVRLSRIFGTVNNADLKIQLSPDGISYDSGANNYVYCNVVEDSTSGTSTSNGSATALFPVKASSITNSIALPTEIEVIMMDHNDSSSRPQLRWNAQQITSGGTAVRVSGGGYRNATQVTKKIRFILSSGNIYCKYSVIGLS